MQHRGRTHARLLCSAAAVSLMLGGAARAQDAAAPAVQFNIPPQPLSSALNAFGEQSHSAVLFKPGVTDAKMSPGLVKVADAETALRELLAGAGLTYERQGSAFVIEAPQGSSAGGGADTNVVQELVVTAQKKSENIQVVPIAISAFTQADLTTRQVAGGPDLMTQVPNFTFTKTNFSGYSIQIRGIGTQAISATTDAAVAVAFNNTPFIRNRFFEQEFYDLERVEVLRGPQGTLYGRNATAGVVNILSAKPTFDYAERASVDVANYSSRRLEGMINMPLVEDKVALRLAGAWTTRDGYDTNQITGNQIDGRDLWSTRLSLRIAPTEKVEANLIWEHFQENDDRLRSGKQLCNRDARTEIDGHPVPPINGYSALYSQGCLAASLYSPDSYEAPNGLSLPYYLPLGAVFLPVVPGLDPYASTTQSPDLRMIESTVDPQYRAKTNLAEFQFRYDIGDGLTLTSETGYLADSLFSTEDYNRFSTVAGAFAAMAGDTGTRPGLLRAGPNGGIFCDPQIGCADRVVAVDASTAESRQFGEELRLSSDFDGPFNFSVGANYLRYDTEDKYYVFINTLSLWAALAPYSGYSLKGMQDLPPWRPGVSDNHECLQSGFQPPDPTVFNTFIGCVYIDPNPIGSLNDQGHNYFLSRNPYKLISYAAFGEAYYNITPSLKLTAGLRWTVDKKEAPRIPSWVLGAKSYGYPVMEVIRQEWREPTGRLALDWRPELAFTDQTLVYASYGRGYKAGGANPPPAGIVSYANETVSDLVVQTSATHPKTFNPEFVNAFEVGTKNTLLDGRLTVNADAFYYDYTGYQISQIVDRSAVNLNFDAKVWGLELEADWRPLKNLRLGFKGGYENTRVADGSKAVDLMDRTAGHTDWMVVRPFPTFTSNCILPVYTAVGADGSLQPAPNVYSNGNVGPCEYAYVLGLDPVTALPYVRNPTEGAGGFGVQSYFPGYIGYNPAVDVGQNHGEGFYRDLGGKELPNAPHFTTTVTMDYTLSLPHEWLATLHTDLYRQSEAWTRIFNTPGYDRLKAYTNVNVAAIFANEAAGWKVMAYVKNVFDRDSITGAFLNSDDTGLTTNVFLTEPRLYGLRVTKEWNGTPFWGAGGGANPDHPAGEPYPLTIEISGQIQRQDAPYETLKASFIDVFSSAINGSGAQNRDLDWGDGRGVKLTYRPQATPWNISAAVRYGKTNGGKAALHQEELGGSGCPAGGKYVVLCDPASPYYVAAPTTVMNWSDASAENSEAHTIVDFAVGRDLGVGTLGATRSSVGVGLRYAQFKSRTKAGLEGVPDWDLVDGFYTKYPPGYHRFKSSLETQRRFTGTGPILSWDAARRLLGNDETGHVDVDWTLAAGVLFGKQMTSVRGEETASYWKGDFTTNVRVPISTTPIPPIDIHRSKSVSAPVVDLSVGLSYEIQRLKLSTGYRWERYFNVLDAGYLEHRSFDRTLDGPYFKVSLGFGG